MWRCNETDVEHQKKHTQTYTHILTMTNITHLNRSAWVLGKERSGHEPEVVVVAVVVVVVAIVITRTDECECV